MFNKDGKLDIFENFRVDRNLPKFRSVETDGIQLSGQGSAFSGGGDVVTFANTQFVMDGNTAVVSTAQGLQTMHVEKEWQPTWMQRLVITLLQWVSPKPLVMRTLGEDPPPPPTLSVPEFFKSVKNTTEELPIVDDRVRGYESAVAKATLSGQVAMVEQLKAGLAATRAETQLHAVGVTTVVREKTLVAFVKKSPKGLRLDWLKNFTRHVPDDVIAGKISCDERGIFDNYVVLHYDPEAKSWAETHKEKEARKDPILFGVLRGSRKLYFVGEWVDEFCDLSLDQMADVLAKETVTEELDPNAFIAGDTP